MRGTLFEKGVQSQGDDEQQQQSRMITGALPGILCGTLQVTAPAAFWLSVAKQQSGRPAREYVDPNQYVVRAQGDGAEASTPSPL